MGEAVQASTTGVDGGERPLLEIEGLSVVFARRSAGGRKTERRTAHAVRELSLTVKRGEVLGLVGESGSGKSVTNRAVLRVLEPAPSGPRESTSEVAVTGRICFDGVDLLECDEETIRDLRGRRIAMIFQEPGRHLNPSTTIGRQIAETIRAHRPAGTAINRPELRRTVDELLEQVGLERRVARTYPHELSGGMKQRAMIAIAVSCGPDLLLADEPVTALDVTIQRQILKLLASLRDRLSMAMIFVSHDLAVVRQIADRVAVMYAGKIIELSRRDELFEVPLHPYTVLLLRAIPDPRRRGERLTSIPGRVPDAENVPDGSAFHPRCAVAEDVCRSKIPPLVEHRPDHFAACHMIGTKTI